MGLHSVVDSFANYIQTGAIPVCSTKYNMKINKVTNIFPTFGESTFRFKKIKVANRWK